VYGAPVDTPSRPARRTHPSTRVLTLGAVLAFILAACGPGAASPGGAPSAPAPGGPGSPPAFASPGSGGSGLPGPGAENASAGPGSGGATPPGPGATPPGPGTSLPPGGPAPSPGPPCGEGDPLCLSLQVQTRTGQDLTRPVPCGGTSWCLLKFDVFWPPSGRDLPEVVMIPGGPLPPGNRDSLWLLARDVAGRGGVVFTADYRSSPAYGGGFPTTFGDVACAIRTARVQGPQFGGRAGGPVTLVAHSFGGFPAAVVSLTAQDFAAPDCLVQTGDGRPDRLVGVAGVYQLTDVEPSFLDDFFGGPRSSVGARWAAGDPAALAQDPNRHRLPVTLLVGDADLVGRPAIARAFASLLTAAGYRVNLDTVAGADHTAILEKLATVDAVVAAAGG
jgi:hypothetical protein